MSTLKFQKDSDWKRILIGFGLSIASAVLLRISFPPFNLGWFIWIGFLPLLLAQYHFLPENLSSLASAIALGGWLGIYLVPMFGGKSLFMVMFPLLVAFLAFFMDKNKRKFHEKTQFRWFIVEGVLGWVGFEMVRSFIPVLGTWAFVGYPLWQSPWFIQPISLLGIYGLDLLIMLVNFVFAFLILSFLKRDTFTFLTKSYARKWMILTLFLFSIWLSTSLILWQGRNIDTNTVRAAVIQPDLPIAAHKDKQLTDEVRVSILSLMTDVAIADGAELIVWPEMALAFDPQEDFLNTLQDLVSQHKTWIVLAYVLDQEKAFRNEAIVLSPEGNFSGLYGKKHPMIASGEPKSISTGQYPITETPFGKLGTMICFDLSFTDVARQYGRQGVQVLAVPALFGGSIAAHPVTHAVFRAIENRTALIMADVAFSSAIVDPFGQVKALRITPQGSQDILVADVQIGEGGSLYAQVGEIAGWISLVAFIFFAVFNPIKLARKQEKD